MISYLSLNDHNLVIESKILLVKVVSNSATLELAPTLNAVEVVSKTKW